MKIKCNHVIILALLLVSVNARGMARAASSPQPIEAPSPNALGLSPSTKSFLGTLVPTSVGVYLIAKSSATGSTSRTVVNSTIMWSGLLLGPALGYWQEGTRDQGLRGVLLRSGLFAGCWLLAPTHDFNDGFLPNPEIDVFGGGNSGLGIWFLGTLGIVISAIHDIVSANDVVQKHQTVKIGALPAPSTGGPVIGISVAF